MRPAWWAAGPFAQGVHGYERRLRAHAGHVLAAALDAVDPERLVEQFLAGHAWGRSESGGPPIHVLAFGKASVAMAASALRVLEGRTGGGLVVTPAAAVADPRMAGPRMASPRMAGPRMADPRMASPRMRGLEVIEAGHPAPTAGSVEAATAALGLARRLGRGDRLLCLLSGGGSALLALPVPGVTLEDLRIVTHLLLRAGASIEEVNTVRKHLEVLKGGGLARRLEGVEVLVLALSDVPGDRPELIASGPLSPDTTRSADAVRIFHDRGIWERAPASVRRVLAESRDADRIDGAPPGRFERIEYHVIGGCRTALAAAARATERLGYACRVLSAELTGEAREVGASLARQLLEASGSAERSCLLAGGETTVTVKGGGAGGRNQELVLAAVPVLCAREGVLLASLATDGADGPTPAAGAVATARTMWRGRAVDLDVRRALQRNDSHTLLDALGETIYTGPTGTNVMDLQVGLIAGG